VSVVPAAALGYGWNPGGFSREIIGCDDCHSLGVPGVRAGGVYVAPSLK
jgi:hypothetical protein